MTTSVDGVGITFSDTTFQESAFIGVSTSADNNTALGYTTANLAALTGTDNVGVGYAALASLTSGSYNVAIGVEALNAEGAPTTTITAGVMYTIMSVGTTDYTLIGAASNTVGLQFTATGVNNGTGTVVANNANTALGYQAGYANTASGVVAVGYQALYSNTSGGYNVAIGNQALYSNVAGTNNVVIGANAGFLLNGSGSVHIGANSGLWCQSGSTFVGTDAGKYVARGGNLAIGNGALLSAQSLVAAGSFTIGRVYTIITSGTTNFVAIGAASNAVGVTFTATGVGAGTGTAMLVPGGIDGVYNCAVGPNTLMQNSTGNSNTAVGHGGAMYSNSSGFWNAAVGFAALGNNTTGNGNAAFGYGALIGNTTGQYNIAMGQGALPANTTGSYNIAHGWNSLQLSTIGSYNVAIGVASMANNTQGRSNTAIGINALGGNTTGNYNAAIGSSALTSNTIGNGNIGIGGVTAAGVFSPAYSITTENNYAYFGSTALTNAYIQVAWSPVSDARDKLPQGPVPHGIDFVNQLKPTSFYFKESRENPVPNGRLRYGFLAQDILEIEGDNPVIIDNQLEEKFYFNEADLIPVLVNAIKDQQSMIDKQNALIEQLLHDVAELKSKM